MFEQIFTKVMASSRNPDELQYYWEQWREKSGKMIKVEKSFTFVNYFHVTASTFPGQLP